MSEKLQKVLARMGVGSRRELDALIAQGRVEVNGKTANVGDRIEGEITVKIDGRTVVTPLTEKPRCRVLMYHKPEGELTTIKDPEDRPTVFDHLPRPDFGRWIYVGRLDLNTSGLLLFTTDGELANALMHPRGGIERVYAVRVFGEISDDDIKKLEQGLDLEDGRAHFDKVVFAGGEGRNQWFHVTLREGRNREVRRLWEAIGAKVSRLIRIKYANIELDPRLKAGQYRELNVNEINKLRSLASLKPLSDKEIARTPILNAQKKPLKEQKRDNQRRVSKGSFSRDENSFNKEARAFNRDSKYLKQDKGFKPRSFVKDPFKDEFSSQGKFQARRSEGFNKGGKASSASFNKSKTSKRPFNDNPYAGKSRKGQNFNEQREFGFNPHERSEFKKRPNKQVALKVRSYGAGGMSASHFQKKGRGR